MARLTLENVTKVYPGNVTAVQEASVDIAHGEFVVLVGPSGCGKSTLLRMIAGLETITGGAVYIGDRVVNHLEPGDRDIAMVFQNYALYPHMSVRDNMAYGLKNMRMPRPEIDKRIAQAAQTLQITEYLSRKPRQLSGGQRQRVAMGRAIVREPAVFLFDEPLSNLDAKLRTHMRSELKDLHRRLGATFVFVTHDQVEAMSLADRIVVLNAGRIEQVGRPMDLYENPASLFVAEFIGAPPMNIVPLSSSLGQQLAVAHQVPAGAVSLGIRPEALALKPDHSGATARIGLIEALGAETVLHAHAQGAGDGPDTRLIVRLSGPSPIAEGTEIGLEPAANAIRWFDASGKAIPA